VAIVIDVLCRLTFFHLYCFSRFRFRSRSNYFWLRFFFFRFLTGTFYDCWFLFFFWRHILSFGIGFFFTPAFYNSFFATDTGGGFYYTFAFAILTGFSAFGAGDGLAVEDLVYEILFSQFFSVRDF